MRLCSAAQLKSSAARVASVALTMGAVFFGPAAVAGIPEPDLVFYGTVSIDGVIQTSGGTTAIEVRQGGSVLSIPILATSPDPLYVARIPIESTQGGSAAGCLGFCLTLGGNASIWVTSPSLPGGELEVGLIELASRGRIVRQDISASSIAGNSDVDGDGVPDFRDNCINIVAGPSQTDTDGNGIGDACEGLDNPGLSYAVVGDADNPADPATGKGNVPYEFEITTTEVSNADYAEFLNAVASSDPNALYNELMGVDPRGGIVREGTSGSYTHRVRPRMAIMPVNFVSWLDAARFANWVENGRPSGPQGPTTTETGAFDLTGTDPAVNSVVSMSSTHALPTEDEHYKSAYYDPTIGGSNYWTYPTRSDTPPTIALATPEGRVGNPGAFIANYSDGADWNGADGNVTAVGSAGSTSFYGASDLGGNVEEWLANDSESGGSELLRVALGGDFASLAAQLSSTADQPNRDDVLRDPLLEEATRGFRITRFVPEPNLASMFGTGVLFVGYLARRRKAGSS